MINIEELNVGDIVKIVDKWVPRCCQNGVGAMDKYLGSFMTVKLFTSAYNIRMEEDQHTDGRPNGWCWNVHCIDYIVKDDSFSDAAEIDIDSFLML